MPSPSIGIDIDGCIDEFPIFFQTFSASWPGKVYIITMRSEPESVKKFLEEKMIRYDELILAESFKDKGKIIRDKGIMVFFDDQPEIIKHINSNCACMLVRNEGNFDFENKRYVMSDKTCEII